MNKIKVFDYSRISINIEKLITKRLKELNHDKISILWHLKYVEDALGCCIYESHEIGLNLKSIKAESELFNIDFYKLICKVISHEVVELLCNDITGEGATWDNIATKLRIEGYGV